MIRHRLSSMLRAAATVLVLLGTATRVARAQTPTDTSAGRKQLQASHSDRLQKAGGLELTAEQKTKLSAISNKHAEEGKAVAELFKTDPDGALKRMVALRAKIQAEVRTVLTAEQRTVFDRNVAEMNAQMNAHLPVAPR